MVQRTGSSSAINGEPIERAPPEPVVDVMHRPLPPEPKRFRRWLRKNITPLVWCRRLVMAFASVFDAGDVIYLIATGLVVCGTWRILGDGYGCIAGGLMLAIPPLVAILRKPQAPDRSRFHKGGDG